MPTAPTTSILAADDETAAKLANVRPTMARVMEALAKAAGDIMLRSKVPAAERVALANELTEMGTKLGDIGRRAWGGNG